MRWGEIEKAGEMKCRSRGQFRNSVLPLPTSILIRQLKKWLLPENQLTLANSMTFGSTNRSKSW